MFLKEFAINRYGPLSGGEVKRPASFTLFFAPNEEGKTLTIDALLKMLFSNRELKPVTGINRVEEKPEGYLVIGTGQEEFKLPDAGRFSSLFEISAPEFRNTFLIRDSDLALTGEAEFYRAVTGRLTGMKVDEIKIIKDHLQEMGGITAGGEFLNIAPHKLKDRYAAGRKLLVEIEDLLGELEAEKFSRFEESLAGLEERQAEIKNLLGCYDQAYNRERYERGQEALSALRDALDRFAELERYNLDNYETWQRCELNRDFMQSESRRLDKERHEKQKQLQETLKQRDLHREYFGEIDLTSRQFKENIEPLLEQYSRLEGTVKKERTLLAAPFTRGTAAASAAVFFLSLAGFAIYSNWWMLPILYGSLGVLLVYSFFRFRLAGKEGNLGRIEAEVRSEAEKLDFPSGDIGAVRSTAGRVDRDLEMARDALETAENDLRWLEKEAGRLKEDIFSLEKKAGQEESRIKEMSFSAGVKSLAQYYQRLEEKQALQGEIENQKNMLLHNLGPEDGSLPLEDLLSCWEEQLGRLESFAGAAISMRYDRTAVEQLKNELEQADNDIEQLRQKMAWRGDQLRTLEKEVNVLLKGEEEYLPCQTTLDLEVARQKVEEWLERLEHNRKKALTAVSVLNRVTAAEEQKVNTLFGAGKPVSGYFKTITGGRYREVTFDSAENLVKVVTEEGLVLDARSLSGGAFDQLYFSVRLALAESLLQGGKGFFILDDPFIKADAGRLQKQLGMLTRLSREGWQIIYFSAKEEVKTALGEEIAAGRVQSSMI